MHQLKHFDRLLKILFKNGDCSKIDFIIATGWVDCSDLSSVSSIPPILPLPRPEVAPSTLPSTVETVTVSTTSKLQETTIAEQFSAITPVQTNFAATTAQSFSENSGEKLEKQLLPENSAVTHLSVEVQSTSP